MEDLVGAPAACRPGAESYSPEFQVCFPYAGLFVWHVGGDAVVADANQVLFVTADEPFALSQPAPGTFGELIITPVPSVLETLTRQPLRSLSSTLLFRRRYRRTEPHLQRRCQELLRRTDAADPVAVEECVLDLLTSAFGGADPARGVAPSTRRMVDRAKAYLEANGTEAVRLPQIADAIGVSPPYLTSAFRRLEGIPLHAYLTQLRLAWALTELPHTEDIAGLALSLGFSSHSHFTAAFRTAFGCTPSAYRASGRLDRPPRNGPAAGHPTENP